MFGAGTGETTMVNERNVGLLQDIGVRWLIVHRVDGYDWPTVLETADALPELERVAEVGDSVIYAVAYADPSRVRLTAPFGTFELGDEIVVGQPFTVTARFENSNVNRALSRLTNEPDLRVEWRRDDGSVFTSSAVLPLPIGLPPGESTSSAVVAVPDVPGTYRVTVSVEEAFVAPLVQEVVVHPAPEWDAPPLTVVSVTANDAAPRPGETLTITARWIVNAELVANFAVTFQLIDTNGDRIIGHDLFPESDPAMPLTGGWKPGQQVEITTSLTLPDDLAAGEYRVLAALYTPLGTYPRVPVMRSDGTSATEGLSSPITVVR
jgi:hypothetical protein